jgi:hypothetical protein
MTKRKLSVNNLYKLIKIIVLVISIPSFLLVSASYLMGDVFGLDSESFVRQTQYCEDSFKEDSISLKEIYGKDSGTKALEGYQICRELIWEGQAKRDKERQTGMILGLGLPAIFFGGTLLIKHLFPREKK